METLSASHPVHRRLREGWGKLRRLYLCHLRPGKVRAGISRRRGACRGCAECCDLLFRCPYLGQDRRCTIYDRRFKPCAAYPIDERDLRNMDCGFSFEPGKDSPGMWGLPIAPWAQKDVLRMGTAALIGGAAGLAIAWLDGLWGGYVLAAGFGALFLFALFFFRDPWRAVSAGDDRLLAAADGRVTDVREVDEPEFLGGPALRVGVFMSLFDSHVNRAPCSGEVAFVRHSEGEWGNVLFEKAWSRNENVLFGLKRDSGPVALRLVAGAVARRIEYDPTVGSRVGQGERIGMVKFGSRAEIIVPRQSAWKPAVSVGQKVKAGVTALFVRGPEKEAGEGARP